MAIAGVKITPSPVFRGRYELLLYGRRGQEILKYIRSEFADDDLTYATDELDGYGFRQFDSLVTEEQLMILTLRFS